MSENSDIEHLEKIYIQASEWIRMCNSILWAMGTVLVPASLGCLALVVQFGKGKSFLAPASVFLFAFWVYVSRLYRASAADARKVLMAIEREWGIRKEMALYNLHGQVGMSRFSLFRTQVVCLFVLVAVWTIILIFHN